MSVRRDAIHFGGFPVTESHLAFFNELKLRVKAMLDERKSVRGTPLAEVSRYWQFFCSYFDYVVDLPDAAFAKIRLHTYHLTGDNYQKFFFRVDEDALLGAWNSLVADVPDRYVLSEPNGGLGFIDKKGRRVSLDIVRYQTAVNSLFRSGVLQRLEAMDHPPRILEIGAGYGGLSYHLARIVGATQVAIVDLPETLIFSGAYLPLVEAPEKVYVYDRHTFDRAIATALAQEHKYILFPSYRLRDLQDLRFDLVLNIASFQEMRSDQVREYLSFVRETCEGVFYSSNQDAQPANPEPPNVSALLKAAFVTKEITTPVPLPDTMTVALKKARAAVRRMGEIGGLLNRRDSPSPDLLGGTPYREYLCCVTESAAGWL